MSFDEWRNAQRTQPDGYTERDAFEAGAQSRQAEIDELRKRLAMYERDGYKLVPTGDTNIADMIWGKCPCGSSMSPIISDKVGYNLIHCFACGANKYIHKDY